MQSESVDAAKVETAEFIVSVSSIMRTLLVIRWFVNWYIEQPSFLCCQC